LFHFILDAWPNWFNACLFAARRKANYCGRLSYTVCLLVFTGESTLNVVAVHSTLHLPYDHRMYGQNLTVQVKICAPYCLSSFILAEVAMSGGYMHYQTINPVTIY